MESKTNHSVVQMQMLYKMCYSNSHTVVVFHSSQVSLLQGLPQWDSLSAVHLINIKVVAIKFPWTARWNFLSGKSRIKQLSMHTPDTLQ